MRERLAVGPRTYFLISAVALVALTLIVFTGAAVRVTGSGLGCPSWPNCYDNGRLVAETNSHALIEFGNRTLTSFVGLAAAAAGLMAFFRVPFRREAGECPVAVCPRSTLTPIRKDGEMSPQGTHPLARCVIERACRRTSRTFRRSHDGCCGGVRRVFVPDPNICR